MELTGKSVMHSVFGRGKVVEHAEDRIRVDFGKKSKKFLFPESFETFLVIDDPEAQAHVAAELKKIKEERTQQYADSHAPEEKNTED